MEFSQSYQLVGKRNLVELHLVDAGLSRAQKRGSGKKSALHDGNRIENATELDVNKDARQRVLRAVVLMKNEDARCKMQDGVGGR
ncbi:unnamed protein product [Fusarium graminearum]|nr:unnamed protein product [Fusarium graminearum]CAG1974038.1 unnamed protein product [Fusarium graminearum]VTO90590.1 unnamed protein product [Fusarium graminearum]